jgi:hypothetical protein
MKPISFVLLLFVGLVACGGSKPAPASTTSASSGARPTCDLIDSACDPHEGKGGLAKECHDLGESPATTEATCLARQTECLAACPAKSN